MLTTFRAWRTGLTTWACASACFLAPASVSASAVAADERIRVELIVDRAVVAAGGDARVGVLFEPASDWHVYWRNPGDSGEPPQIRFEGPPGFAFGPIQWPAPTALPVGPLVNYGYEGAVLLAADLDVAGTAEERASSAAIAADVTWLVCRADECVPGTATLRRTIGLGDVASAPNDERFLVADAAVPRLAVDARLRSAPDGDPLLVVDSIPELAGSDARFFPLRGDVLDHAAEQRARWAGGALELELSPGSVVQGPIDSIDGVLVLDAEVAHAFTVQARRAEQRLASALLLALVGGVLLNLMPCVFPVLSLKVLGFIEQSGSESSALRRHGWGFTAGVLASFWVLGGALLILRSGGEALGWGFQLQSPAFVATLAALMFVLALNLAGVFELRAAPWSRSAASLERREGLAGSFWSGALTTVVATPCTAPFMGGALGYALSRPAWEGLSVFSALGVGVAFPVLALSHFPALLRRLPRPGAWMETLKQFLAFPLFATVLWLLSVFGRQTSDDARTLLSVALLVAAFACWSYGRATGTRAATWRLTSAVTAVLAVTILVRASTGGSQVRAAAADEFWQPWAPETEAALRDSGTPVFVNFTADWCISCQVNERLVFATDRVRNAFRDHGVVALKADWTNRDARIARALSQHGRESVPLYVYYGRGLEGSVLPQVPTPRTVIDTIGGAGERSEH